MADVNLPPARRETEDVSPRALTIGLALTLAALLLSASLAIWLYPATVVDRRLPQPLPVYPAPRLQSDPAADLSRFLQEEKARLNGSGWVDRAHGIAHIPIDQAMQEIVKQGIADWPTPSLSRHQ